MNEALNNAGFGIQLCDVAQVSDGSGLGSEISMSQGKTVQITSPTEENLLHPRHSPKLIFPVEQPEQTVTAQKANYTEDMSVDEICARMSLDEARTIAVTQGTCRGWTLGQVAEKRSPSLKWDLTGCAFAGNILKAGAKLLLEDLKQKKAG